MLPLKTLARHHVWRSTVHKTGLLITLTEFCKLVMAFLHLCSNLSVMEKNLWDQASPGLWCWLIGTFFSHCPTSRLINKINVVALLSTRLDPFLSNDNNLQIVQNCELDSQFPFLESWLKGDYAGTKLEHSPKVTTLFLLSWRPNREMALGLLLL